MDPWQRAAVEARSTHDLLNIAREFVATFTPAQLASVPEACRPPRIRGIDGLHDWQQRLAEAYCDGAAHTAPSATHTQLISFLTAACDRALALATAEAANDGRGTRTFQR